MIEDFERKLAAETERADYAWRNARVIDAARMEDRKRFEKCEQLVNSLLDPEMYGFAVTAEVRDAARAALGRPAVETPNARVEGCDAASSRRVPWNDGLAGTVPPAPTLGELT